jgi:TPR repeat protein
MSIESSLTKEATRNGGDQFSMAIWTRDSRDIIMKARLPLVCTLLLLIWFCLFTSGVGAQQKQPSTSAEKGQPEISSLQLRAQQGNPEAEYLLGRSYMTGTGVPQNYEEAAKWFLQSAAQGSADAEFSLGYLYEHGDGVARDYQQAVSYYSAAAKQGHATAENNFASMYESGRGVKKNIKEAERWYSAAAERSDVVAQCNLASLYFRVRNYSQAAVWFRAAAQQGDATAQEDLAWMYYTGTGIGLDYSEAAKWVRLAAEQGYARAQLDLGYLYEQGKGVPLDYPYAYVWYRTAASGGEKRAAERLKSIEQVMTQDQIKKAKATADQLSRSLPKVRNATNASSIANSFIEPR